VLNLVTVSQVTGFSEISWTLSPSPDVKGYVVYVFINDEGYAIDTIRNPLASNYTHSSLISSEVSRSYVVAAFDNAGNISTLSNVLKTIYLTSRLDSCSGKIEIGWNSYPSYPREVLSYTILGSLNGGAYTEAGKVPKDVNSYTISQFSFNAQYCFIVRADMEDGFASVSNNRCLSTKMQVPPQWINAGYATVGSANNILLSFTIDPASEIRSYILERKTGVSGSYSQIHHFKEKGETFVYSDANADIRKINHYRLSALNSCNIPVTVSNIASNIVPELNRQGDDIILSWNPYKEWRGGVGSYILSVKTGSGYEDMYTILPYDTLFTVRYSDIMYEVAGNEVCFIIKAFEAFNPYGVPGESHSSDICTEVTEIITVPNVFTPDNNLVNDLFFTVLSFTPEGYHLLITDLRRKTVYESRDHTQAWDGTRGGDPLPEGVYLWYLEVRTPSGKAVKRRGTVTIIRQGR